MTFLDMTNQIWMGDALLPFAFEEIACRAVGEGQPAIFHLWRHERAFIMGLRDRKLPQAEQAMDWLQQQGYEVAVRHSGGAAVPLDHGVLNASLILPKPMSTMGLHDDFQLMAEVIIDCLRTIGAEVKIGEISGSYCPGDYDLSIGGKKFCGLAQRRQTKAIIVQAFIVVEGTGVERAMLAQQFYRIAAGKDGDSAAGSDGDIAAVKGVEGAGLEIDLSSMTSLAEQSPQLTVTSFVYALKEAARKRLNVDIIETKKYEHQYLSEAVKMSEVLRKRYNP